MSVPDYRHVPQRLFDTGLYALTTHDGSAAFVDACIATLNGLDSNFRHLKKKPGQTDVHGHGEDSFLYLLPDNRAQAGDFIEGAGGSNPKPRWGIDPEPYYTHADAHDPDDHGIGNVPPPPQGLPGRAEMMDEGRRLHAYYASQEGLQRPQGLSINDAPDWEGVGAWLFDVYLAARVAGKSREDARAAYVSAIRHTDEWRSKHPGETP